MTDISHARAEYSRLIEECGLCNINASWLEFEEFEGKHEFCKSDELLDALINKLRENL